MCALAPSGILKERTQLYAAGSTRLISYTCRVRCVSVWILWLTLASLFLPLTRYSSLAHVLRTHRFSPFFCDFLWHVKKCQRAVWIALFVAVKTGRDKTKDPVFLWSCKCELNFIMGVSSSWWSMCTKDVIPAVCIRLVFLCIVHRRMFFFCLFVFLLVTFCYCIVTMGFLPSHWKFRLLSPGKVSCYRVALPNPWCMLGVLVFP